MNNIIFGLDGIYVGPATTDQIERMKFSYKAYDQIIKNFPEEMKNVTKFDFIPKRVIVNCPATIIVWNDDTKTVVKCNKDDNYDLTTGILLCFIKKLFGNNNNYHKILYDAIDNAELQFKDNDKDNDKDKDKGAWLRYGMIG